MKRWLIYDYDNRKETIKMYKKVLKSNNTDEDKKDANRLFILREMELDIHRQSMRQSMQRGTNDFIQRQGGRVGTPQESLITLDPK